MKRIASSIAMALALIFVAVSTVYAGGGAPSHFTVVGVTYYNTTGHVNATITVRINLPVRNTEYDNFSAVVSVRDVLFPDPVTDSNLDGHTQLWGLTTTTHTFASGVCCDPDLGGVILWSGSIGVKPGRAYLHIPIYSGLPDSNNTIHVHVVGFSLGSDGVGRAYEDDVFASMHAV